MVDESPEGSLDGPADDPVEHFAPTGGRVTGILGLLVAAAFFVVWALDPRSIPAPVGAGALVAAVLVWSSLLRPRVSASRDTLYLRNMLETIHVPMAAIDELAVRQVLAIRAGDKRFVCPAVGRRLRKVMRAPRPQQLLGPAVPDMSGDAVGPAKESQHSAMNVDYADHVENRIRDLIAEARERRGIRARSEESEALARDVRREPSWPEIGALAATTVLFVVTLFL